MIDETNYERYFLNFLSDTLSEQEVEMLMDFFKKNPDLENSFLHFDNYSLEANPEIILNKNFLYKSLDNYHTINEYNFDEFCIAYHEKDLSPFAQKELANYLNIHKEKIKDFESYRKIYIKPPLNIKYPFKSNLKKINLLLFRRMAIISSAAAIILLFFNYLVPYLKQTNTVNKQSFSINEQRSDYRKQEKKYDANKLATIRGINNQTKNNVNHNRLNLKQFPDLITRVKDTLHNEEVDIKSINSIKINDLNKPNSNESNYLLAALEMKTFDTKQDQYLSPKEFVIKKLHRGIEPNRKEMQDDNKLTWWDIAKLGVTGINKLTGSEIIVDTKRNDAGKMVAMTIESGNFSISRTLSK